MQKPLIYLFSGLVVAMLMGVVIAATSGNAETGKPFSEKYIAKLQIRVRRGSWDAWSVKITDVHYNLDQGIFALDIGKALSFWTGEYKVCAVAYRNGFELDKDCQTVKLSPGDTKDVSLSLNLGEKPTAKVRITIYDEGGEIKDEREVTI